MKENKSEQEIDMLLKKAINRAEKYSKGEYIFYIDHLLIEEWSSLSGTDKRKIGTKFRKLVRDHKIHGIEEVGYIDENLPSGTVKMGRSIAHKEKRMYITTKLASKKKQ